MDGKFSPTQLTQWHNLAKRHVQLYGPRNWLLSFTDQLFYQQRMKGQGEARLKKVPTFWFQRGGRTRFAEHLVRNQGRHTRTFLGPYLPLPAPTHDWTWARLKEVAEAHPENWLSADCLYSSQDLLPIGMDRIIHMRRKLEVIAPGSLSSG